MSTEFNYVVNVDTTRVMGAMAEVRSQVGMALQSPTGFATPATSLPGGGAGTFVGGAVAGLAQMQAGFANQGMLSSFGSGFGTFTNPSMAYSPHYGMIQAETSMAQEWQVNRYGLAAAQAMRPPGVGAYEFAMGVEKNRVDRQLEAGYQSFSAARSTLLSGAGGLAAGEAAYGLIGAPAGAFLGGRAAARFGLPTGAGKMLGGFAGGMAAFMVAEDMVGGAIRDHYAEVERIGGVTRELGDIAGAGRDLSRTQRYDLGRAARLAAGDAGMDVNMMGDILALGGQAGMLPTATDPKKARQQLAEFAQAIDEGAQTLHTSLANATRIIKGMTGMGYGAQEGVSHLVGMAGAAGVSPSAMFAVGQRGASMAQSNFLTGRQGFDLFTGGVMAAAGSGVGSDVLQMMGGVTGAGQMIGMTQMRAALSPLGDVQLMAAQTGAPLGGAYDLASSALAAAGEGGDLIGNMLRFDASKDQIRRGIGAKGIRTMAMGQVDMHADLLMDLAPSMSRREARISAAMNSFGMTGDQARVFLGSGTGGGGGGGGGGYGRAAQIEAYQTVGMNRAGAAALGRRPTFEEGESGGGFDFKYTKIGAAGFLAGGWTGVATTAGGLAVDTGSWLADSWDYMWGGPGVFASAEAKADYDFRYQAEKYDSQMDAVKRKYGAIPFNRDVAARVGSAPLREAHLDIDAFGDPAAQHYGSLIALGGLKPVGGGPGTMRVQGQYYSIAEARDLAGKLDQKAVVDQGVKDAAYTAVVRNYSKDVGWARTAYRKGMERFASDEAFEDDAARDKALTRLQRAERILIDSSQNSDFMLMHRSGDSWDPRLRGFLQLAAGGADWTAPSLNAALRRDMTLQGGMANAEDQIQDNLTSWMISAGELAGGGGSIADKIRARAGRAVAGVYTSALAERSDFRQAMARGDQSAISRIMKEEAVNFPGAPAEQMIRATERGSISPLGISHGREMAGAVRTGALVVENLFGAYDAVVGTETRKVFSEGPLGQALGEATKPVTFADEAQRWVRGLLDLGTTPESKPGGKRRRKDEGGSAENAIGFGQREQAMTTINRSLRRTHKMLTTLDKRISKMEADPSAGSAAGGGDI